MYILYIWIGFWGGTRIDKVYIDGSCGTKTVSVFLAHFRTMGNVTHYYKDTIPIRDILSYGWVLDLPIPIFAVRMGP